MSCEKYSGNLNRPTPEGTYFKTVTVLKFPSILAYRVSFITAVVHNRWENFRIAQQNGLLRYTNQLLKYRLEKHDSNSASGKS